MVLLFVDICTRFGWWRRKDSHGMDGEFSELIDIYIIVTSTLLHPLLLLLVVLVPLRENGKPKDVPSNEGGEGESEGVEGLRQHEHSMAT